MRQGRFLTGSLRREGPLPYGRGSETPGGGAFQQAAQSVMHPLRPCFDPLLNTVFSGDYRGCDRANMAIGDGRRRCA